MITGLNEAQDQLKKLASIGDRVSFSDMFTPQFMSEHTSFATIEDLFEKSGFKVDSSEDFKAIPDEEWEEFITQNTSFSSWEGMQQKAFNALTQKVLEG